MAGVGGGGVEGGRGPPRRRDGPGRAARPGSLAKTAPDGGDSPPAPDSERFDGRGRSGHRTRLRSRIKNLPDPSRNSRRRRRETPGVPRAFDTRVWNLLISTVSSEGFPSGQREQTVNLSALPSKVRILPPPPFQGSEVRDQESAGHPGASEHGVEVGVSDP